MRIDPKRVAWLLIFCLSFQLAAPIALAETPSAPALGLLGVQQQQNNGGVAAQPRAGVVPAGPAPAAPQQPSLLARAWDWTKKFGAGVVDGFVHAVPNLIDAFKKDPVKTGLMVGGLIALGIIWPPGALIAGGIMVGKGIYDSGGDPTKLGQLTGETAFWVGAGIGGARVLRAVRGARGPVVEGPLETPAGGRPVTTTESPVLASTETPVAPRGPPVETAPVRTGTTETPVTASTETPPVRGGTTEAPPATTTGEGAPQPQANPRPPRPPKPPKVTRPAADPEVLASDATALEGRGPSGHWKNPVQPSEVNAGPPASQKYVADSNVFSDLPNQAAARARMDGVIDNPANNLIVPESIQGEFLGPRDINGTQAARWGQTGARRTPVSDPANLAELAAEPGMVQGAFGPADLALMETALQNGATVVTRNFRLIQQIRGPGAPLARYLRYRNVKIEYIGD